VLAPHFIEKYRRQVSTHLEKSKAAAMICPWMFECAVIPWLNTACSICKTAQNTDLQKMGNAHTRHPLVKHISLHSSSNKNTVRPQFKHSMLRVRGSAAAASSKRARRSWFQQHEGPNLHTSQHQQSSFPTPSGPQTCRHRRHGALPDPYPAAERGDLLRKQACSPRCPSSRSQRACPACKWLMS